MSDDRDPLWDHVTGCRAWAGDPCTCADQPADAYLAGGIIPPLGDVGALARVHAGDHYLTRDQVEALAVPPLTITLHADATAFDAAMVDAFRQLAAAVVAAFGGLAGAWRLDPDRWRTDVPPTRWRDWQPADERPVDRARRQHLDRQLRTLNRRAARRRKITARREQRRRAAAPWYAIRDAGLHGAAALDVLRHIAEERLALTIQSPGAGLIITSVQP